MTKEKKPRRPRKKIPSLRKSINAKCKDCIYDDQTPGSWRAQVEDCNSEDCSLWAVRPKTKTKEVSE